MSAVSLSSFEGKNISDICDSNFHDDSYNHCAHFVSHVLGLRFGYTCRSHTGIGSGANLRVHEVFGRCPSVGVWADRPKQGAFLVFVTDWRNVDLANKRMVNHPKKHIGIFLNDQIWHYSNSRDQVVKQGEAVFLTNFRGAYGSEATLFFGAMPVGAHAVVA